MGVPKCIFLVQLLCKLVRSLPALPISSLLEKKNTKWSAPQFSEPSPHGDLVVHMYGGHYHHHSQKLRSRPAPDILKSRMLKSIVPWYHPILTLKSVLEPVGSPIQPFRFNITATHELENALHSADDTLDDTVK
jgi:hypothetical protein